MAGRIADIDTPEASKPGCPDEARLGAPATPRPTELLDAGPLTLASDPDGRDSDVYDRKRRVLTRDGRKLDDTLVREGLAEEWRGYRRDWC